MKILFFLIYNCWLDKLAVWMHFQILCTWKFRKISVSLIFLLVGMLVRYHFSLLLSIIRILYYINNTKLFEHKCCSIIIVCVPFGSWSSLIELNSAKSIFSIKKIVFFSVHGLEHVLPLDRNQPPSLLTPKNRILCLEM